MRENPYPRHGFDNLQFRHSPTNGSNPLSQRERTEETPKPQQHIPASARDAFLNADLESAFCFSGLQHNGILGGKSVLLSLVCVAQGVAHHPAATDAVVVPAMQMPMQPQVG